jgi:hypothetical protein
VGIWNRPSATGPAAGPGTDGSGFLADAYGGIEIGASGIKALVVRIPSEGKPNEPEDEALLRTVNTAVVTFSDSAVEETAREVGLLCDEMSRKHRIPPGHIYIAASSGVADAAKAAGPAAVAKLDVLHRAIKQRTDRDMDVISPDAEAMFGSLGIIPNGSWFTALAFDVGSGNTKGGYLVGDSADYRFMTVEVPYGTKTFSTLLETRCGEDPAPPCVRQALQSLIVPLLDDQLERKPALLSREEAYLSGGSVWALAVLAHPAERGRYVTLTAEDIRTFRQRLQTEPEAALAPDVGGIADPAVRAAAVQEIQKVKDTFNRHQLLAGIAILELLSEKMEFQRKKVSFVRNGLSGWLKGYVKREAARAPKEAYAGTP